jgi:hypothetical protein
MLRCDLTSIHIAGRTFFKQDVFCAELLMDNHGKPIPYVALNVQNTGIRDDKMARPLAESAKQMGMFLNGRNCGRWLEITFGQNCVGYGNDVFTEPATVCGGDALAGPPKSRFQSDKFTGMKVYAVVADSCQDHNYW